MFPRALSTHSLCLRPFTYLESKHEVPELMLNLQWKGLGYTIMDYKVRNWAKETYEKYSKGKELERVYVLAERKENNIVGFISFNKTLFISILKEYQGRGYAAQALESVYYYMKHDLHMDTIQVGVHYEDLKMMHLLEKYCDAKVSLKDSTAVFYLI